ncbi:MAG: lysophospholipid acyltransferase family protein [Candidatus Binatia bacterium]|nr:lysophospholipid acyltransferase family protein [Candidatus Binatia bacterium]
MAEIRNITSAPRRKRPGASGPGPRQRSVDADAVRATPSGQSLWQRLQEFGQVVASAATQHLAPELLRDLDTEIATKIDAAPLATNDFGFDPWGFEKETARRCFFTSALLYRYYFRVQTRGIENLPAGRVLLIGNHAGQIAIDAAMIATACLMEGNPPRIVRGMGEYWLSRLPWLNILMVRFGSVVGTPKNCVDLLEHGEAVLAFPEGVRGMNKGFSERYQLQDFGLGFLRLALQTGTPIVPVATVGSEEQAPSLGNLESLAGILGMPAFPMVLTPVPLPVRYHVEFGEPLIFEGNANDEDHVIEEKVNIVKARLRTMLRDGLERRAGIFS